MSVANPSENVSSEDDRRTEEILIKRRKRRSVSLDNVNILAYGIPDRSSPVSVKTNNLDSSPGKKPKHLKKKLNVRGNHSRSSTELSPRHLSPDSCSLSPDHTGSRKLSDTIKDTNRNSRERRTNNDETDMSSYSVEKLTPDDCKFDFNFQHSKLGSSENILTCDSPLIIKCEYFDDANNLNSPYEVEESEGTALIDQQLEKLWKKIEKTKEDLIQQQAIKDENVADYLKTTNSLANSATNSKMKLNFERNNQKANVNVQLLQKKLDKYHQQVKEIEENGVPGTKKIMKVVQDSVRSGTSSIADVVSKPLESFNNFIKKEKKNSSVENFDSNITDDDETEKNFYQGIMTTSDEENCSCSSSNLIRAGVLENIMKRIDTSEYANNDDLLALKDCVKTIEKESIEHKQDMEILTEKLSRVLTSLQEEQYKTEQLQIRLNDLFNQWNDSTELHQNEMMGMKDEMDRTLENIECVEYRFTERTANIQEDVDNCITRISKLEKHQQDQQPIDTILDIDAKVLLSKFVSFIINICVVFIFILSSLTKLVLPFISSRARLVVSVLALTAFILWKNSNEDILFYFRDNVHKGEKM